VDYRRRGSCGKPMHFLTTHRQRGPKLITLTIPSPAVLDILVQHSASYTERARKNQPSRYALYLYTYYFSQPLYTNQFTQTFCHTVRTPYSTNLRYKRAHISDHCLFGFMVRDPSKLIVAKCDRALLSRV